MERKEKNRLVNVLLAQLGIMSNKADILGSYGVESTTQLSDQDIDHLIARLKLMQEQKQKGHESEVRQWRSNILTLLNKMGIYATNNDWTRVNNYLLNPRISGRLLYELTEDELKALYRRLLVVYGKNKERSKKENMQKLLN